VIERAKLVPAALLAAGLASVVAFGFEEIFVPAGSNYSTAEIALEEHWIKGAAPILAANFESVKITNVNKDVEESFVFDVALGQIYEIDANYEKPPLDVRELNLEPALAEFERERSEVFCNNKDLKYCELVLAWDDSAPANAEFVGLRIADATYALVERGLAERLGVALD
jgi:hypothetical protein